jgi:hypothetical protein
MELPVIVITGSKLKLAEANSSSKMDDFQMKATKMGLDII